MRGIPVLHVEADCIARAWEDSLIALHGKGCEIKTQYDKLGDPPSKDATMIITITDPLKEPMIHKDFPGGPEDLQEYVMEVCEGIKDHLVRDPNDPEDTRWEYCVAPDTAILMSDYSEKPIKDCQIGEDVLCFNFLTHQLERTRILDKVTTITKPIRFQWSAGTQLIVSRKHPLYVPGKAWTIARDLQAGNMTAMARFPNEIIYNKVVNKEVLTDEQVLYDIAVAHNDHNFIGNGVICHNTYHQRLFGYEVPTFKPFDQIDMVCQKLAEAPYTRRAQAITWKVWEDNECYDPACLQSLWCRIIEENGQPVLSMNVRFRSNDAYKAAFMNIFALIQLQKKIAERVSELSRKAVNVGRYCHMVDSYHIYGSYFEEFERRFLNALHKRTFERRTMRYEDFREFMEAARPKILEKARNMGR